MLDIIQSIMKEGAYLFWPVLFICVAVIIGNCLYRWPLYHMGVDIIVKMQAGENIVLDWFFLLVTMIIDPTIVFAICILIMVLSHKKANGFVRLVFILLNTFCAAVLKAYDSDPRPIWTEQSVRNIGLYCPIEYGNPSGHSWFSAVFGFGLLLDYKGPGPNYIFIWFSLAAVVLMPISRMYLGAHSLNQVLQGLILGLGMCVLYQTKLKSIIRQYLKQFNTNNTWKYVIAACHIIYIIPYVAHRKQELPPEWQKNILDKCNVVMNQHKLNSLMFVVNALLVSVATGIGLGYEKLSSTELGEHYLSGVWHINQQKYQLKKGYIVFVFIQCACLLSGLVLGAFVYIMFPYVAVAYVGLSIGGIISGYVYTVKTCQLLQKFKVIAKIIP